MVENNEQVIKTSIKMNHFVFIRDADSHCPTSVDRL